MKKDTLYLSVIAVLALAAVAKWSEARAMKEHIASLETQVTRLMTAPPPRPVASGQRRRVVMPSQAEAAPVPAAENPPAVPPPSPAPAAVEPLANGAGR